MGVWTEQGVKELKKPARPWFGSASVGVGFTSKAARPIKSRFVRFSKLPLFIDRCLTALKMAAAAAAFYAGRLVGQPSPAGLTPLLTT